MSFLQILDKHSFINKLSPHLDFSLLLTQKMVISISDWKCNTFIYADRPIFFCILKKLLKKTRLSKSVQIASVSTDSLKENEPKEI